MKNDREQQDRFMRLYEPVHQQFLRYCEVLTKDSEAAKDLVSEVVLTAYQKLDRLKKEGSFLYFLFGIARHTHLNLLRKRKRETRFNGAEMQFTDRTAPPDVSADVRLLYEAMATLPDKQREALVLFEISGFAIKEIQEIQGGSLSAVKLRLVRGRDKLKKALLEHTPVSKQ